MLDPSTLKFLLSFAQYLIYPVVFLDTLCNSHFGGSGSASQEESPKSAPGQFNGHNNKMNQDGWLVAYLTLSWMGNTNCEGLILFY